MNGIDLISRFMRQLDLWIYDNIGTGDGTQHIRTIWKDDRIMSDHLVSKWNRLKSQQAEETGTEDVNSRQIQKLAMMEFISALDENNLRIFIRYIAENGRS